MATAKPSPYKYNQNNKKKEPGFLSRTFAKVARAVKVTFIAGAIAAGPAWYHYGTIEVKDVVVKKVDDGCEWSMEKRENICGDPLITTTKGVYTNTNSLLSLKFNAKDIQEDLEERYPMWRRAGWGGAEKKEPDTVFAIKSYGYRFEVPLIGWKFYPNIVDIREVTEEEMAAREEARKLRDEIKKQERAEAMGLVADPATVQPGQVTVTLPPAAVQQQVAGVLSGNVTTLDLFANGYRVQITMPVEAAGKITVNNVQSLNPPQPPPAAPRIQ